MVLSPWSMVGHPWVHGGGGHGPWQMSKWSMVGVSMVHDESGYDPWIMMAVHLSEVGLGFTVCGLFGWLVFLCCCFSVMFVGGEFLGWGFSGSYL